MSKDLLREAIADAKAVRSTAIANAKLALEEAFTPKLQSMLSNKIAEEMDEDDMEETDTEEMAMETDTDEKAMDEKDVEETSHNETDMEETDDEKTEMDMEETYDETEVEETDDEKTEMDMEETDSELEEIIKELEEEEAEEDEDLGADSQETGVIDAKKNDAGDPGAGDVAATDNDDDAEPLDEEDDMEEMDLDEIINALREEDDVEETEVEETEVDETELEEAYKTIRFLKSKINEVNLLNSKLLYSNKLFRNKSLSESQKMKVIETFDRANSVREVKLVYSTLAESLTSYAPKSKKINEGFASKSIRSTKPSKDVIVESNTFASRMQKLAGLK